MVAQDVDGHELILFASTYHLILLLWNDDNRIVWQQFEWKFQIVAILLLHCVGFLTIAASFLLVYKCLKRNTPHRSGFKTWFIVDDQSQTECAPTGSLDHWAMIAEYGHRLELPFHLVEQNREVFTRKSSFLVIIIFNFFWLVIFFQLCVVGVLLIGKRM